jgi:hypothetical protein
MSDEIRVNRPQVARVEGSGMDSGERRMSGGSSSKVPWIILAVVILALVVLGVIFRDRLPMGNSTKTATTQTDKPSGYQAVFLTNGQVYFGKLSHEDGQYATLTDIYYLQVSNPPPALQGAGSQNQQGQAQAPAAEPQLQLIKLGNELHGPVDSMQINRDQILFFEEMKEGGKVMTAIRDDKTKAAAPAPSTKTPAPGTTTPAPTK